MEEITNTTEETEIDQAVAEMPEEVQDFLWSNAFDLIIRGIQQALSLTDQQKKVVKDSAEDLLMELTTMEEVFMVLKNAGMSDEIAIKTLYAIDQEIITRAENLTEFFTPDDDENIEMGDTSSAAPSPTDVLASLKARLTAPTSIAPVSRELPPGPEKPTDTTPQTPKKPFIDLYREMPK